MASLSPQTQTRLSVAVTALLAGMLVWQLLPMKTGDRLPEKQQENLVPQAENLDRNSAANKAASASNDQKVVMLPPPPAPAPQNPAQAASPLAEPVVTSEPVRVAKKMPPVRIKPLKPTRTPTVEPTVQPEPLQVTPLKPEILATKIKPQAPEPDPLAGRKILKPQLRQASKTVTPRAKLPVSRPQPAPAAISKITPAVRPSQPVQHASVQTDRKGRALLRVLEHGKGPEIRISWPDGARARDELSRHLRQCFGMQLALMDNQGQLYVAETPRGAVWSPNRDYYSGFVRQTAGHLPRVEQQTARDIRRRHGAVGSEVHIFPRRVDALMLGALNNLVGASYNNAQTITARYDNKADRLVIRDIRVDGRAIRGHIDFSGVRHCHRSPRTGNSST